MATFAATKGPGSMLDFLFDWSPFLDGDVIEISEWDVPSGLVSEVETNTTSTATVWLSGGVVGMCYDVVCRITSVGGRIDDRTIQISVMDK